MIIYSNNLNEYKKYIKAVFEKIKKANLKLKLSKCQQFQIELKFVRYLVGRNDIRPNSRNVKKIKNTKVLKNLEDFLRQYNIIDNI